MIDKTTLILLDGKSTRHSVNALLGALETDRELDTLEVRLAAGEAQLGQHVAETLAAGRRPIVGLSFPTPRLWRIGEMMRRLRPRADGQAVWLAGGPHPTADPEGTLRLGFDIVVRGEGEATLLDLVKTIAAGGDLAGVAGIAYRDGAGAVQLTGRRAPLQLDDFPPFPQRRGRVAGPIEITRGCPFACGYCQTSHLLGMKPRHRGVETVARYAAVIHRRSPCDVRVITPNAFSYGSPDGKTLNLAALEALLATLRQTLRDDGRLFFGTFPSEVRPEHVTEATLGLVKRYANNNTLIIGAQSGSQRLLDRCGRGHGVSDIIAAVSRTIAAGMKPHVDFIFGLPGETDEDWRETAAVIRELAGMGAMIHAHTFMPLPQTGFAHEPPGRIPGRMRPFIKEMIRGGVLYGIWHEQEREAARIARYIREGTM